MTTASPAAPLRASVPASTRSGRRTPALLAALLGTLMVLGLAAAPMASAADRNFSTRFSVNDTGDIDIFGNTLMTCPTSASGCTAAQQSGVTTTSDSMNQNNAYVMRYVDIDGDASTFNSSSSQVALPTGSTVLFAGLYWGARTAAGSSGSAAINANARNVIKLKAPGASSYTSLTADTLDDGSGGIYQGFKDVTSIVKAAGSGTYTAADVQASTGGDTLAGWSLVIAYRDTSQPARNLSVFDGIKSIGGGQTGSIAISGFTTPPAGAVKTRVGFVTYEGDAGIVGDSASLNGTVLSDAQHPATNFFNSRSSRDGVLRTATNPNYPNNLGIEQSILKADGILGNSATSATIGLTSSGDVYAPGVVTFATELYAPKVDQTKTVEDVNGGLVEQGDTLRYTIKGTNSGQDGAANFVLRDPIPANTTYVANSLKVSPTTGGNATETASDATDTDRGEFDATQNRVVARLGTGSNGTSGGTVPAGGTYTVTFDVKVGGPSPAVASDTDIKNVATASFASASLGTPLTAQSDATATVQSPDLTITKTGATPGPVKGQPYSYAIAVKNSGDAKTQGTVTVTDTLPTGLTVAGTSPASTNGWTCTNTTTTFTCTRSDALAAGASYPTLTLNTNVAANAPTTIANTASVSGGGDGDPSNNTGTATNNPGSSADLAVVKTSDVSSVAVGGNVVYSIKVTNNGSSDSTGSVVTDTLPAGLTYVSAPNCTGSTAATAVTCNVGPLAAGATRTFTVTAKPAPGTAGTSLRNTASVTGNEPDPDTTNNSSSKTVDVKPVDLKITSTIQGNPPTFSPNTTYTWNVGVTNQGGSDAPNSVVRFDVPTGTTVDTAALDPRCTVASGVITCNLGTVAAGATVTPLQIPLRTVANPPAAITTVASVTTTENDVDQSNNTATTSTPVVAAVDLGVTLSANPGTTSAGDTLTLTATVKNNGPATPQNPKVTIDVPAGTTIQGPLPANCTAINGGTQVVCDLNPANLAPGQSTTAAIVVKVGSNPGATIDSSARVTTVNDTDPSNDQASLQVPVVRVAGLSITKSASSANAKPGDTVTYTLKASNAGPAAAQDVVIDDVIPAGTTFVSADSPCTFASGKVTCAVGDIAAGDSRTVTVRVQVSPLAGTFDANATQDLDVQKNEVDLAIPAKDTGSATASCPTGYFATDGSVRLESVDQGVGNDLGSIHVRSSRATADGSGWTATVDNDATGRAQMKVTVVCLKSTTVSSGSHVHPLLVSAPISTVKQLPAGRSEVVLTCGTGRVAVAPSYTLTTGASGRVSGSQRDGQTGWKFTVDTTEADNGTFSVRCLSTTTGAVNGHVHDLGFTQLNDTVVVPANQTGSTKTTKTLTCTDGKGIVGGSLVPPGLTPAGNDPQPVSRVFGFQNTTGQDLTANVGLLCLGIRTGGELGFANVVNTATVKTSTQDATTTDDSASATFTATNATGDTGTVTPPPTPTPVAPRPLAPATPAAPAPTVVDPGVAAPITIAPRASVLATSLRVSGTTSKASVAVPVSCATACTGTAKLVALGPVKASATIKKGTVLATVSLKLKAGKKTTIKLAAKGKGAKALRLGRVAKAQLVITTGKGVTVQKTVRISTR